MDEEQKQELGRSLFELCLKLFITPELESRYNKKRIVNPFPYTIAQVIFFPDGKRPIVNFDDEVSGKTFVQMRADAVTNSDRVLTIEDIAAIMDFQFDRNDYPDSDHATFFRHGDQFWHACYDLKLNKELSARHLTTAHMFYLVAVDAQRRRHWPPLIDNLYSACELTAKAALLVVPDRDFQNKTSHTAIKSRYNIFAFRGVRPAKHQEAFNKLHGLRTNARYMRGPLKLTDEEITQLMEDVMEMMKKTESQLKTLEVL